MAQERGEEEEGEGGPFGLCVPPAHLVVSVYKVVHLVCVLLVTFLQGPPAPNTESLKRVVSAVRRTVSLCF